MWQRGLTDGRGLQGLKIIFWLNFFKRLIRKVYRPIAQTKSQSAISVKLGRAASNTHKQPRR